MLLDSPVLPVVLIIAGILYLIKPDIFQRWFWKRTAISQQIMTPEQNKVYMRVLGAVFIVVGIVLLLRLSQLQNSVASPAAPADESQTVPQ